MKRNLLIYMIIGLIAVMQLKAQNTESYSWNNVAIGGGGFVSGVFFSPIEQNVLYTRTDVGGAYRWDESNQSWISLMDWVNADERGLLGVEAMAVDPNVPGKVYMMAGTRYWNQANDRIGRSAFLRSSDYGQTWDVVPVWDNSTKYFNVHGNGMGRGSGERLAVDPDNSNVLFYGSRNKGLWKSTDNGSSWSKVNTFPLDTTWNGCGISFVAFDPNNSDRIYAGAYRKADNIFISEDKGDTWSLIPNMPQPTYDGTNSMGLMPLRISIRPDGSAFYITLGNGAGPHTMRWNEGWGPINDWFNRGAVYKYDVASGTWSDISPQNFINPEETNNPWSDPASYFGTFSGISINPNNPDHIVVSSCASYRGPQFWKVDGTWYDEWGDNIWVTTDGGETWIPSFRYYWLDGGVEPSAEQMNENGIPWMVRSAIHWIGSVAIDPYNSNRVFVTSGNGVFKTEDIFNYELNESNGNYVQNTRWDVASHGIEEVVPQDLVSIPGGPMLSVIGDYDGFVHDDVNVSPANGRYKVDVSGTMFALGTTTGLAYAPQNGRLAKCAKAREVSTRHSTIPIGPVQWSTDNGATWTTESHTSNPPSELYGGKVALSADGEVTLWMPSKGSVMYRNHNNQWTEVSGISFNGRPVGDQVDENMFYCFNTSTGYMFVSTDKGVSFTQSGYIGQSRYKKAVAVPGNEGHVWAPVATWSGDGALMRSSDGGNTFTAVPGVGFCEAVGFGKVADGADYPTVFVFADIDGVKGVWRSIDQGASWVRVNDDAHEYGGLANGEFVIGDMNVFGRVYMSTAGRGIAYGDPTGSTVPVTGIAVSPSTASVGIGGTIQLNAEISPSNASNQGVNWNSGNSDIASVSSNGLVTGISAGTVSIIATSVDGGFIASAEISVSSIAVESVAVTPASVTLDPGETQQLTATITPSDATNKNVAWSTSDASIATVDENGLVTAISYGSATITVTTEEGGHTASSAISVNYVEIPVTGVSVSPASATIAPGETVTLVSTLEPLHATNQVVAWSSDNESAATVNNGVVTAVAEGTATITVTTDDGGYTSSASITVSTVETGTILCEYWDGISGVSVSDLTSSADYPDNPSRTEYLTSIEIETNQGNSYGTRIRGYIYPPESGSYIFWLAGDDNCSLYLSTDGSVTNSTRIAYHEGWTNSQEFDKYPTQQSAAIDLVAGQQYYIEVLQKEGYGGDNLAVAWEGPGIERSIIGGSNISPFISGDNSAPVAALTATPTSGEAPLEVNFDASASSDPDGDVLSYSWDFGDGNDATGAKTSNTYNIAGTYTAKVTVSDGSLSAVKSVKITVVESPVPVTGVAVAPTTATINVNESVSLTKTVSPSNATNKEVSWGSSDSNVASVSAEGVVTGVSAGSATITVTTVDGGFTATSNITVNDVVVPVAGVTVNPETVSIIVGATVELTATVVPANATNKEVVWSTDDASIATVDDSGIVTGVGVGFVTLTATTGDGGFIATSDITVTDGSSLCENPEPVALEFKFDGEGEYCWFISEDIAKVNSWAANSVTINGVDYTNKWSNSMPDKVDGGYYVVYSGSHAWSHFEAAATKSADGLTAHNTVQFYPNPFSSSINLVVNSPELVTSIEVFDNLGRVVEVFDQTHIKSFICFGEGYAKGLYSVRINSITGTETYMINKN